MRAAIVLVLTLFLAGAVAAAEEAPSFAGKSVGWWIDQLGDPKTEQAAYGVIRSMGAPALPALVSALSNAREPKIQLRVAPLLRDFPGDPLPQVDLLASALADPAAPVRQAAAYLLSRLGEKAKPAVAALSARLGDPEVEVRRAVANTLMTMKAEARDALPALLKALADADPGVRRTVIIGLGRIGPAAAEAVPTLLAALRAAGADDRPWIVQALGGIGPTAPGLVSALVAARRDPSPDVRVGAATALAACAAESDEARNELLAAMGDEAPAVRLAVLRGLQALKEPRAPAVVAALVGAAADPDAQVRFEAIRVLGGLGEEVRSSVVSLANAVRAHPDAADGVSYAFRTLAARFPAETTTAFVEGDLAVRGALLIAFERAYTAPLRASAPRLLPALAEFLLTESAPEQQRRTSLWMMTTLCSDDPTVVSPLLEATRSPSETISAQAFTALTRLPAGRGTLFASLSGGTPERRLRVLQAVESYPLTAVEEAVVTGLLHDPDARVRLAVATRLAKGGRLADDSPSAMERGSKPLLADLARVFSEGLASPDAKARWAAARSLGAIGEASLGAVPSLVARLGDVDRDVVRAAAVALARIARLARASARDWLTPALDAKDAYLRAGAALALAAASRYRVVALPLVELLLEDGDAKVRAAALEAAGEMGREAEPIAAVVERLASDADPAVGRAAREALARIRSPK